MLFLSLGSLIGCNNGSDTPTKPIEIIPSVTNLKIACQDSAQITFTHETIKNATANITFSNPGYATAYKIGDSYTIYGIKTGETKLTYIYSTGKADVDLKIIPKGAKTYLELRKYTKQSFSTYKDKEIDLSASFYIDGTICDTASMKYEVTQGAGLVSEKGIFKSNTIGDNTIKITPIYDGVTFSDYTKEINISVLKHFDEINVESYKYIGRTITRTIDTMQRIDFDNPSSGIEFAFFGTSVKALLKDVSKYPDGFAMSGRAKILIDNSIEGSYLTLTGKGSTGYIEAKNLEDCYHTAKIVNCFEEGFIPTIVNISTDIIINDGDGKFAILNKTKDKSMLVIGDSTTTGYGAVYSPEIVTADACDSTYSYAYQTANLLNYDLDSVASQSIGVRYGYRTKNISPNQHMINLYQNNSIYDLDTPYDRSGNQHDIVVINLGTYDSAFLDTAYAEDKPFEEYYVTLMEMILDDNPNAYVFPIYGMVNDDTRIKTSIVSACEIVKISKSNENIYPFFDFVKTSLNYPTKALHTQNAKILADFIDTTLSIE